jgi:hypothetical protein
VVIVARCEIRRSRIHYAGRALAIFLGNRHLLDDLPALGAAVIQEWAKDVYGVRLMILVVRHTFGRHLNFNPHLHVLASAGGLRIVDGEWISGWRFDQGALMRRWPSRLLPI